MKNVQTNEAILTLKLSDEGREKYIRNEMKNKSLQISPIEISNGSEEQQNP